jgi:hypothetical protein
VAGECTAWLELEAGGFRPIRPDARGRMPSETIRRVRGVDGWVYQLEDGAMGWFTPARSAWSGEGGRAVVRDPTLCGGLLISRLTRPIEAGAPEGESIRARVADWLLAQGGRPAWLRSSRTGPTPVGARALPVAGSPAGSILAIEVFFQLEAGEGRWPAGRYGGVLIARVPAKGAIEVLAGEGIVEAPSGVEAPRSARLRGVVDLDGDGVGEVVVSGGGGPEGRIDPEEILWRAGVALQAWRREVRSPGR